MKIVFAIIAFLIMSPIYSQSVFRKNTKAKIEINSELSAKLLDQNQNLNKVLILAKHRKQLGTQQTGLTIGASLITIVDYQKSNTDSKFGYLMRHPTSNNQIGKEVSEAVIHSFQLSATGNLNKWIGIHAELLYNPEQSFGAGTITALNRNQIQLYRGFAFFGNLQDFPLYLAIGKMDVPFSQTGSVSPFTNSTLWHAFGGIAYGAQLGFSKWGINARFMLAQGGAQFRALNTIVGENTATPSKLNNYSADLNYTYKFSGNSLKLGGSYLNGCSYCQAFPITHFSPAAENNPAISYYGKFNLGDKLEVKTGYARTLKIWQGTHNPNPPLDIFPAAKVSSFDAGAKFNFNLNGEFVHSISGEYSNFRAGAYGSPWERQEQIILGISTKYKKTSRIFIELLRTEGYSPLNFISGGNFEDLGETHSKRSANSMGIIFGTNITF